VSRSCARRTTPIFASCARRWTCSCFGNQILRKQDQPEFHEDVDWRELYELD
jgi:hypothetical protein